MSTVKYPLHYITASEFEILVVLICKEILGAGTLAFAAGKDGGRDAKFTGKANKYPSEINPWSGKFIIQAKHTSIPESSCTESSFSSILKKECKSLTLLKNGGYVDYYLLFTNRKLSGVQDPKIEKFIDENVGVSNAILADENIQIWLKMYPKIGKILNLNRLLLPLQFYEKDMQDLVIAFSDIKIPKGELRKSQNNFEKISLEEKNRLNNLSKDYFDDFFVRSFSEFEFISRFLGDPANYNYVKKYNNTVADIQEEIIINRNEYAAFEEILNHLYKLALDEANPKLIENRRLLHVFLHYMYFYCDIGKTKEPENVDT